MRLITLIICCSIFSGSAAGQPPPQPRDTGVAVLRSDPRLKVIVSFKFDALAPAEELLNTLHKATGVPLSWDGQPEKSKASFGNATVSNMPAWKVMDIIAAKQVTDGKWEKSGEGYVLHGAPKDFAPRADSEKAKADKKLTEEQVAIAKVREDFAKFHPLGLDTALQAQLSVVEKNPKLTDLFDRLATATKLKFTLADNLRGHEPELGDFQFKNTRAFTILEIIAARDLDNGSWVKTDDGYRLEGVSRRRVVVTSGEGEDEAAPAVSPSSPDRGRYLLIIFGAGLLLIMVVLASVLVIRKRSAVRPREAQAIATEPVGEAGEPMKKK